MEKKLFKGALIGIVLFVIFGCEKKHFLKKVGVWEINDFVETGYVISCKDSLSEGVYMSIQKGVKLDDKIFFVQELSPYGKLQYYEVDTCCCKYSVISRDTVIKVNDIQKSLYSLKFEMPEDMNW